MLEGGVVVLPSESPPVSGVVSSPVVPPLLSESGGVGAMYSPIRKLPCSPEVSLSAIPAAVELNSSVNLWVAEELENSKMAESAETISYLMCPVSFPSSALFADNILKAISVPSGFLMTKYWLQGNAEGAYPGVVDSPPESPGALLSPEEPEPPLPGMLEPVLNENEPWLVIVPFSSSTVP